MSVWPDRPQQHVRLEDPKAAYEHLRAAYLNAVRASLEDHVARLEWPHQRIEHYRTERLRSLLAFARERSPFHAARMAGDEVTLLPGRCACGVRCCASPILLHGATTTSATASE